MIQWFLFNLAFFFYLRVLECTAPVYYLPVYYLEIYSNQSTVVQQLAFWFHLRLPECTAPVYYLLVGFVIFFLQISILYILIGRKMHLLSKKLFFSNSYKNTFCHLSWPFRQKWKIFWFMCLDFKSHEDFIQHFGN